LLDVHNSLGGITLREHGRLLGELNDLSRHTGRIEKPLSIKSHLFDWFQATYAGSHSN
jgi:hypothetical protein